MNTIEYLTKTLDCSSDEKILLALLNPYTLGDMDSPHKEFLVTTYQDLTSKHLSFIEAATLIDDYISKLDHPIETKKDSDFATTVSLYYALLSPQKNGNLDTFSSTSVAFEGLLDYLHDESNHIFMSTPLILIAQLYEGLSDDDKLRAYEVLVNHLTMGDGDKRYVYSMRTALNALSKITKHISKDASNDLLVILSEKSNILTRACYDKAVEFIKELFPKAPLPTKQIVHNNISKKLANEKSSFLNSYKDIIINLLSLSSPEDRLTISTDYISMHKKAHSDQDTFKYCVLDILDAIMVQLEESEKWELFNFQKKNLEAQADKKNSSEYSVIRIIARCSTGELESAALSAIDSTADNVKLEDGKTDYSLEIFESYIQVLEEGASEEGASKEGVSGAAIYLMRNMEKISDEAVKLRAFTALVGKVKDENYQEACMYIIEAIGTTYPYIQDSAQKQRAFDSLAGKMNANADQRKAAIVALTNIYEHIENPDIKDQVCHIIEAKLNDPIPEVRLCAARAIVDKLIVPDKTDKVKLISEVMLSSINDNDLETRDAIFSLLFGDNFERRAQYFSTDEIETLLQEAVNKINNSNYSTYQSAMAVIPELLMQVPGEAQRQTLDKLTGMLNYSFFNESRKNIAIHCIGEFGAHLREGEKAILLKVLIEQVADTGFEVQKNSLDAIVKLAKSSRGISLMAVIGLSENKALLRMYAKEFVPAIEACKTSYFDPQAQEQCIDLPNRKESTACTTIAMASAGVLLGAGGAAWFVLFTATTTGVLATAPYLLMALGGVLICAAVVRACPSSLFSSANNYKELSEIPVATAKPG